MASTAIFSASVGGTETSLSSLLNLSLCPTRTQKWPQVFFPRIQTSHMRRKFQVPLMVIAMAAPKAGGKGGKPRKVVGVVKLALDAGKATPAPPVGPALGSKGVNIMAFCKEYNAKTSDKPGYVIPVEVTVYDDKSFTFILKTPPASVLLLKAAVVSKKKLIMLVLKQGRIMSHARWAGCLGISGANKGSKDPKISKVGKITVDQLRQIATEKLPDLNCKTVEAAMRIVAGTAANMGVDIDPPILQPKKKEIFT